MWGKTQPNKTHDAKEHKMVQKFHLANPKS